MTNNKINKLKNIIQLYTNLENMTNNKLAVEWLAKSYVDLLTKLNNEEISLKEFEIQYIELLEQAKEMEIAGKEMSYADGYAEGYKRALEMIEWYIKNHISGMPSPNAYIKDKDDEQSIIDYNKMEEESEMDNYNEMKDEQDKIN
jgi:hypothetical protein